jgi:hypothetical protein
MHAMNRHPNPARRGLPVLGLLAACTILFPAVSWSADSARSPAGRPAISPAEKGDGLESYVARLGVDRWHAANQRGHGIKVAILDSGFHGYRDFLGRALPARVTARSFRFDGNLEAKDSQHGIICAEVVHTLAPEAELFLANWEPDEPRQFLRAVRWAREQGCQVISCSVIMPSWSDGEGGGAVHEELAHILGQGRKAGDVLCFASAGNIAQRHWSGPFHRDAAGFHEWGRGHHDNLLTPWGKGRVSVELCCESGARYDLSVYDETAAAEVSHDTVGGHDNPRSAVARFDPLAGHRYEVRVRLSGGRSGPFHLVALGSGLQYVTARGSVCFPGDGAAVIAVGAVSLSGRRAAYSSCGPNSKHPKPDLVAPVPFPSRSRSRPFGGTSAAAPAAAALAALCWSQHPDWTAAQVRTALQKAALDLGPPGPDDETGYGLVQLPETLLARAPTR